MRILIICLIILIISIALQTIIKVFHVNLMFIRVFCLTLLSTSLIFSIIICICFISMKYDYKIKSNDIQTLYSQLYMINLKDTLEDDERDNIEQYNYKIKLANKFLENKYFCDFVCKWWIEAIPIRIKVGKVNG